MVKIEIEYQGQLITEVTHAPSGTKFITDAPLDNGGKGSTFSPTDLVAAALGSCMATVMDLFARRHSVSLKGTRITVEKTMVQQPLRRIGELKVDIFLPLPPDHPQRAALERTALTCPVHQSLHPEVKAPVTFHWVKSTSDTRSLETTLRPE
jgi:putative redox protein